jgi:hypothetical protein
MFIFSTAELIIINARMYYKNSLRAVTDMEDNQGCKNDS